MTDLDGLSLIALLRRLAVVDEHARSRAARLLMTCDMPARAVLAMAAGEPIALAVLRAQLDMSSGGVTAIAQLLDREGLITRVPDPDCPRRSLLRLSDVAARGLTAAVEPLTGRLDVVTARLTATDRDVIARYLGAIADIGTSSYAVSRCEH